MKTGIQGPATDGSSALDITYQYDVRGQLLEENRKDAVFRYTYDAAGNRIRKEETGENRNTKTVYSYNEKNQLIHTEEFLEDGSRRRNTFTYSKQGSILREETESGISRYFYNSKNQQIRVECADGQIQENRYDAFGAGLEVSEELPNRIRYTGQQYDEVTEQYYLRARYYNPILGRFLQEDVYQGDGLNLYAYCRNNPVAYYDPSGYEKKKISCDLTNGIINEDGSNERTIINSAGQEVTREYVEDDMALLREAEKEAGGNLDAFEEYKPNWYRNKDGTIKIEWNLDGHKNPKEGPHVTVRRRNDQGGWTVSRKIFIKGRDNY